VSIQRQDAVLVLADGFTLRGLHLGATGRAFGPLAVSTALASHATVLAEADHEGKIVVFTTSHVGATGTTDTEADEPLRAAGVVTREAPRRASNWQATGELEPDLAADGVVGICEVDTRALVRHLHDSGPQQAAIFSGPDIPLDPHAELTEHTTSRKDA